MYSDNLQNWILWMDKLFCNFLIIFYYLDCTKCKFHDLSLTFPNINFFPWPSTKFPDFSLTLAKSGISLTFPWPLDTLCFRVKICNLIKRSLNVTTDGSVVNTSILGSGNDLVPLNFGPGCTIDGASMLVQVTGWYQTCDNYYLNQWWPFSLTYIYVYTRHQVSLCCLKILTIYKP